jgi:hypothetical protein
VIYQVKLWFGSHAHYSVGTLTVGLLITSPVLGTCPYSSGTGLEDRATITHLSNLVQI